MKELKTMKVNEIKNIAKAMGIKGWYDMKKAQLIEAIENHQQTEPTIEDESFVDDVEVEEVESTEINEEIEVEETTATEETQDEADETIEDDSVEEVTSEASDTTETVTDVTTSNEEENITEAENEAHRKNKKRLIEYNGKTQTLTGWAKELGIRHQTLYNRIVMKGIDPATAFEMPIKKSIKKEVN